MPRPDPPFDVQLMQDARVALRDDLHKGVDGQGAFDDLFQRFACQSSTDPLSFVILQLVFIERLAPASVESTLEWIARTLGIPEADAFRRLDEISARAIDLCEAIDT